MATIPDALLLCSSTPYARRGELFRAWEHHFGKDGDVLVWVADSRSMHPTLRESVVQRAYEQDAVAAASEYGQDGVVSFRSDVEAFISREAVEAIVEPGRLELPPVQGVKYVAFVDPAGGSGADSYVVAVAHADEGVAVLDCVREIRPRFSPDAATAEHANTLKSYGLNRVTGDRYAGSWPEDRFREYGISYEPSILDKSAIYRECLPLINSKRVELLDSSRLKRQFVGLERRVARSGKDSIDHGPGQHDDLCNAAAGALVVAAGSKVGRGYRVWFSGIDDPISDWMIHDG